MSAPLVTFVLYAYNEERYIREAIESAFAQTYSPLEIILSDDGSSDRTFDVMQEMAAAYRGPHKIILNRNEKNIGIGSQLNAAWLKSEGELLVLANGDDVSLAHRVASIVENWLRTDRKAAVVCSAYEYADSDGLRTGKVVSVAQDFSCLPEATLSRFGGPGAVSMAVSRKSYERFGLLAPNLILEDGPLNLRSTLTGHWCFIDEPLVLYRVHENNISQAYHTSDFESWRKQHRKKAVWQMREGEKAYVQMLSDLYSAAVDEEDPKTIAQARINAARSLLSYQLKSSFYSNEWAFSPAQWLSNLGSLFLLGVRVYLKKFIPLFEYRNDRWHYRSVMSSSLSNRSAE